MNIAMLSVDYLPNIGGIAAHVHFISKAMIKAGHNVIVINPIPGEKDSIEIEEIDGVICYKTFYNNSKIPFIRIKNITKSSLKAIRKLQDDIGSIDILHQHDYLKSTITSWILSKKIPWLWTNHTSYFVKDYKKLLKKVFLKIFHGHTKGIITVSDEILHMTKKIWGPSIPITYIPNGVTVDLFNPEVPADRKSFGLSPDDFVILCPRRMVEKNGVIFLARAASLIIDKHPEIRWKFIFLGDTQANNTDQHYANEIKKILKDETEKGYIKFMGNLPLSSMPVINAAADIVVLPSLIEAVSLSALEAMATQKPVIATNVGGLPEIIWDKNTGLLIEPGSPEALAESVITLYHDNKLKETIAKNGYDLAIKKYTWDTVAERTVNFYLQHRI